MIVSKSGKTIVLDTFCVFVCVGGGGWGLYAPAHPSTIKLWPKVPCSCRLIYFFFISFFPLVLKPQTSLPSLAFVCTAVLSFAFVYTIVLSFALVYTSVLSFAFVYTTVLSFAFVYIRLSWKGGSFKIKEKRISLRRRWQGKAERRGGWVVDNHGRIHGH